MLDARTCARCGVEKPLTDFYTRPKANGEIGHRRRCKACEKELNQSEGGNDW